jgi:protein-tyrosine phosphatase
MNSEYPNRSRARSGGHSSEPFTILVVCQANRCRSPLMEFLLRRQAELRNLDWQVSSAGIEAVPGGPPHPFSVEILAERGIETNGWLSRPVHQEALDHARLILTATEEQREAVERLDPRTINRTFPLMQFAFLARSLRPPRMVAAAELGDWLLSEGYWRRKKLSHFPMTERDLDDPIGRPVNRFRQCAQLIDRAYADILAPGPPARRA